ncbi:MAG: hypothetical protein M0P73_05130 [Syntrophobacterales bacterium]|nr:hypothetical protein [Syntrophobacterales bacterium]
MSLMYLPQAKWGSGTGRQVILKGDFAKLEAAVLEGFELTRPPAPEYVDSATVQVKATADCKAGVMLCGFPSPLARGQWVAGGLSDGRYRENAAPVSLNLATAGHLWGSEKANQWYAVYAIAAASDAIFALKAMPVLRVASQDSQVITLRNNANGANIGYGFTANELAGAGLLILSGASRGLIRNLIANNDDNATAGTLTYGGTALSLAQGDWGIVLPSTNFLYLGMMLNDADSNLAPFYQEAGFTSYRSPRQLFAGPINGYTLMDLGLAAPPTACRVEGYAAAANGYDVKLAVSYDGANPALVVHALPPATVFQGERGAIPFACRVPDGGRVYLNNDNTANQAVKITGWRE